MRTIMILVAMLLMASSSFAQLPFWQAQVPLLVGTSSDAAKPSLEFGGGAGVDAFLWHVGSLMLGIGGGLYGTLPFKTGNASVRVRSYKLYSEERLSLAYVLAGSMFSIIPTLSLKSEIGAAIFKRNVQKSSSTSIDMLVALGPSMSIFYVVQKMGFGLTYSLSYGSLGLHQYLDLSLVLNILV